MTDDQRPDLEWPSEDLAAAPRKPEPKPEVEWPSADVVRAAKAQPQSPVEPEPATPEPAAPEPVVRPPEPVAAAPEPPPAVPEPPPPAPAPEPPPEPVQPEPVAQPPLAPEVAAYQPPPEPTVPAYEPPPQPEVPVYQPPAEPAAPVHEAPSEPVVPVYQPPADPLAPQAPADPYEIPPSGPQREGGYTPPPEYQQLPGENLYGTPPAYGEQPYGNDYASAVPLPPPPVSGPYDAADGAVPPRETEDTAGPERSYFRKDIEGLRAVAVLAVVFFHVGLPYFDGGFVGVDVFYVISGFLITGLLLREGEATGKVDLLRFYARRMRRLLPAALLVIVVTLVMSALLVTPLRLTEIAGDAAASALYVANFRFALDATNYLATETPSPLLHFWSLGVEEQFYLVWPLILLLVTRFLPGRLVGAFFLVLAAASFALSLYWTNASPEWAFFSPFTRAWELAAGALIAIGLLRIPRRAPGMVAGIAVAVGLLLILASVVMGSILIEFEAGQNEIVNVLFATPESPFPGVAALLPVLGAMLVIMGGSHGRTLIGRFVLGNPVSRYIGHVSYSFYLWHWPILILVPIALGVDDLATRLLLAAAAFVVAIISTELWERPFRRSDVLAQRNRSSVQLGLVGSVAVGAAALLMSGAITLPSNIDVPWVQPPKVVAELAGVKQDLPAHVDDGCHLLGYKQQKLKTECVYGDVDGDTTAMLVGDSHAAQWMPALDIYAREKGWRLEVYTKAACAVIDVPVWERSQRSVFDQCLNWRGKVLKHIRETQPDVLFVGLSRDYELWDGTVKKSSDATTYWREQLTAYLATVDKAADRVVLLAETPFLPYDPVDDCLAVEDATKCDPPRSVVVDADYAELERRATVDAGAELLSANELLCNERTCPVYVDGAVFRDNHHVTASYMKRLAEPIGNLLEGRPAYPTPPPTAPAASAEADPS